MAKKQTYPGEHLTVTYDPAACSHAGECVRGLPEVFDAKKRPWIKPDAADAAAVAEAVSRCPSGALAIEDTPQDSDLAVGAQPEEESSAIELNQLQICANGPAIVSGQVRIMTREGAVVEETARVALCRCGASANKPYCDGSHKGVEFTDEGLLPEVESQEIEAGDEVVAVLAENGPVIFRGPMQWCATDGSVASFDSKALCRCGESANKPFCDGTHKGTDFRTEGR